MVRSSVAVILALAAGLLVGVAGLLDAARARAERAASRRELARALRREQVARRLAEAASRARDEFLSVLSHELRTPLNAILGWTRLLRDGQADPERTARGLAVVDRNGRALAQVVADLLDVSRISRGVIELDRLEVDLGTVALAALEVVRPAAEAKGVGLAATLPGGIRVLGDPVRLQQVAWNLLSNAVKFTPRGGQVAVILSAEAGEAELTVEDTGMGIARAFLPHVFERFRQADGSATRGHGGLGLGLALTRDLVALHGGSVAAASAGEGRGASFRIRLPRAGVAPATVLRPVRPRLEGARILVVEDEADSREVLLQLLGSWGARAAGVSSAAEALAAVAADRPEILVSDIAMPGADGCALVGEVRRAERALGLLPVPAIALTAFTRPDDRRRMLAAGFDTHLAKPVDADELLATLAALLRRAERGVSQGGEEPARAERPAGPGAAPARAPAGVDGVPVVADGLPV